LDVGVNQLSEVDLSTFEHHLDQINFLVTKYQNNTDAKLKFVILFTNLVNEFILKG